MSNSPTILQKVAAWGVHLFTASGLLTGYLSLLAVGRGDWQAAALWLLAGQLIDGVDGTLARAFRVREVLPGVDGKLIDYVIDFANYAIIPAYFIHRAVPLPAGWEWPVVALILLVSALYYGIEEMVSTDYYFVGFPVMWNMVAFYLVFLWHWSPVWNAVLIAIFAVLHFVPVKFPYPSRATRFRPLHLAVSATFLINLVLLILQYPSPQPVVQALAWLTAAYYAGMAMYETWFISRAETPGH